MVKYYVENDLSLFEFHDADFTLLDFSDGNLVVSVKYLNVHKRTEYNPSEHDMEIECARITFKGFCSPSYEPGRIWKTGEDGKSYPVGPRVVFYGQDAIDRILEELKAQICVYHLEKKDDSGYSIGGSGIEPYFTIEFDFDSVLIEWDEYGKMAWYESHKCSE